jgi:predicted transcriptional regulator
MGGKLYPEFNHVNNFLAFVIRGVFTPAVRRPGERKIIIPVKLDKELAERIARMALQIIIPVKLDKELAERIARMALRLAEGKSTVMRMAMRIGLQKMEAEEPPAPLPPPPPPATLPRAKNFYPKGSAGGFNLNES